MFDEKQSTINESNSANIEQDFEIIYRQLIKQFDGSHVMPIREAGVLIGYSKETSKTLASKKRFPIPCIKIGKQHYVLTLTMARFLTDPLRMSAVPPMRVGRPKKGTGPKELAAAAAKKAESKK